MQPVKPGDWNDVKYEEALEIAGYGKFNMYIIFLCGLTICVSLLSSMDVGYLLPAAECDLQLTSSDKGLLGSAYFFGVIATSHLSGFLADTLGRRYILLRGLALNTLAYLGGAIAPEFWTLFFFKFFSGVVTCPCMIATFPFLGEYVPAKQRSRALLITTALASLSLMYSAVVGWLVLRDNWSVDIWVVKLTPWRLFYLLCGIPTLICSTLFFFTPESPKFLLTRGKKGDTIKVLQRVASVNSGKFAPEDFIVKSVTMDVDETVPPEREKGMMGLIKQLQDQTVPLFKPPYLQNLVLCTVVMYLSFLCVNCIFLWTPEVTNRIATFKEQHEGRYLLCEMLDREWLLKNISQLINEEFNTTLFVENETNVTSSEECKTNIKSAIFIPNLIVSVVHPIVMVISSIIVPYVDRRYIITCIMVICASMAFTVTLVPNATAIIILFAGIPVFVGVAYNVLTGITIEIFPTYIRAMAVSITMICGRLGSITGSQLFSLLIDRDCYLLFRLFCGFLSVCAVVPFFFKLKKRPSPKTKEAKTPPTRST